MAASTSSQSTEAPVKGTRLRKYFYKMSLAHMERGFDTSLKVIHLDTNMIICMQHSRKRIGITD